MLRNFTKEQKLKLFAKSEQNTFRSKAGTIVSPKNDPWRNSQQSK